MGLDAFVFCDCYEKGRLRAPPPAGVTLRVEPDGSLGRQKDGATLEADLAWDQWHEREACAHPGGILLHHRLGNISLIGLIRAELQPEPEQFPVLLRKIVYSGSHAGDHLPVEEIPALQRELETLRGFRCSSRRADRFMVAFRDQMSQLVTTALSIGKPIAF